MKRFVFIFASLVLFVSCSFSSSEEDVFVPESFDFYVLESGGDLGDGEVKDGAEVQGGEGDGAEVRGGEGVGAEVRGGEGVGQNYYRNDKFGFRFEELAGYKVEFSDSGESIYMRKGIISDMGERGIKDSVVEISVSVDSNVKGYENLGDLIFEKYSDCSVEFFGDGVFVTEEISEDAFRRYFYISEDRKFVIEAYLRVFGKNYSEYKDVFDSFVSTIEEV